MTTPENGVQSKQQGFVASSNTVATSHDKDWRMWMAIRRAMFIAIQAIEERYGMVKTKAGQS